MADETNNDTQNFNDAAAANGADTTPQVGMIAQYIKDFSTENPHSPACFSWDDQPQIDVQVNIEVNNVNEEVHEVVLKLAVKSVHEAGVAFDVDLSYGALFGLRNIPAEQAHPFLFGEAPRLVFPFARRIVADAVRDAGFPPLVLEPIDFNALYVQQRAQADQLAAEQPAGEA